MRNSFKDSELKSREGSSFKDKKKIAPVVCFSFVLLFLTSEETGNKFIAKEKGAGDYSAFFYSYSYLCADILCALL